MPDYYLALQTTHDQSFRPTPCCLETRICPYTYDWDLLLSIPTPSKWKSQRLYRSEPSTSSFVLQRQPDHTPAPVSQSNIPCLPTSATPCQEQPWQLVSAGSQVAGGSWLLALTWNRQFHLTCQHRDAQTFPDDIQSVRVSLA